MRLFNTLGRKLEDFKPIKDHEVTLYTCGPTVYDYAQIGNLRSFVFDDTLRRALRANGYNVKHVMNITDVGHLASDMDEGEDKLEKGAAREGKNVWEVAEHYTTVFKADMKALNVLPPNGYEGVHGPYAKATDFIDEQIDIIRILLEKGFAYQTQQAIYFDVSKLADYGELSGQKLSDKEVGARSEVITDSDKHHPQDFALWFFLVGRFAHHTMHWSSPWGEGFPGWHLECSAIIHATLGDPIDIHTGGVDHIGTHHTNEMAQTEAAFGHKLANYWVHHEFLLVDDQRMGKSLGNFFTLKDVVDHGFDPMALRLLFLQAHYRSQMNFTWESLEGAQNRLMDLRAMAALRWQPLEGTSEQPVFEQYAKEFMALMSDDLNTPALMSKLSELQKLLEVSLLHKNQVASFVALLTDLDNLLGLELSEEADISDPIKKIVADREKAREYKDWQKADELRAQLEKQGIGLRDTDHGAIWFRL